MLCECANKAMPRVDIVLLTVFIVRYCSKPCAAARTNFTRQPLFGYRCGLDDTSVQTTILNTNRAQCVWRCLSTSDCEVVSHNHLLNSCELSRQLCDRVVSNGDFSVNIYGMDRKLCPQWVPKSEFDELKAIVMLRVPTGGNGWKLAVARKKYNAGLYPGKQARYATFNIWFVDDENKRVPSASGEVLLVDPACLWAWIPYIPSNDLPVGAVAAGYDVKGEPLYVAKAFFENDYYNFGYYKPSTKLGYFAEGGKGAFTAKVLDILVILWGFDFAKIRWATKWRVCYFQWIDMYILCLKIAHFEWIFSNKRSTKSSMLIHDLLVIFLWCLRLGVGNNNHRCHHYKDF